MDNIDNQPNNNYLMNRLSALIKRLSEGEKRELLKNLEEKLVDKERKDLRRFCNFNIDFLHYDQGHNGLLHNISCTGAFIETNGPFSEGEDVSLNIPFANSPEKLVVIGKVVRNDHKGIGVKFNEINANIENMLF